MKICKYMKKKDMCKIIPGFNGLESRLYVSRSKRQTRPYRSYMPENADILALSLTIGNIGDIPPVTTNNSENGRSTRGFRSSARSRAGIYKFRVTDSQSAGSARLSLTWQRVIIPLAFHSQTIALPGAPRGLRGRHPGPHDRLDLDGRGGCRWRTEEPVIVGLRNIPIPPCGDGLGVECLGKGPVLPGAPVSGYVPIF